MKKLLFMRHAETGVADFGKSDVSRFVTKSGFGELSIVSNKLLEMQIFPDIIWSSSAHCAKQSTQFVAEILDVSPQQIVFDSDLYHNTTTLQLLARISNLDDALDTILIVGHNPWISYVTMNLSKSFAETMPTSAICCLGFSVDSWSQINYRSGSKRFFITPSNAAALSESSRYCTV